MECAYCHAELDDPDRCGACRRGQPVEVLAPEAAPIRALPRKRDPATAPVLLLVVGLSLLLLAPAVDQASDGLGGLLGLLGAGLLVAAFFVPLVSLLRRMDRLEAALGSST